MSTVPDATQVRERTREYLRSSLCRCFRDDEDLFTAGLVSSLFAAQLVMFVESRFGIVVEDEELELSCFGSIDAITDFVLYKTAVPAAPR